MVLAPFLSQNGYGVSSVITRKHPSVTQNSLLHIFKTCKYDDLMRYEMLRWCHDAESVSKVTESVDVVIRE